MYVNDFDYYLPEELIAQRPITKRSDSRLMVLNRSNQQLSHHHFYDIVHFLTSQDVIVINDTKVLPSRIYGRKMDTNAHIELLLLKETPSGWQALAKPARRIKKGTKLDFSGLFTGEIVEKETDGLCTIVFHYQGIFLELLEQLGEMPLPPYIHEKLAEPSRYQTVYASNVGSAAAPTAGLHFTDEILTALTEKGVQIERITLHIGLGTFRGVGVETVEDHKMHSEFFTMKKEVAERLNQAKVQNKRIICVGTTSARTLEAIYTKYGTFQEAQEETDIFIYPGYNFKAVDALITNFHLPKSTLIMLVSAFATRTFIMQAYKEAVEQQYRFFSFGDAMLII